MIYKPRTVDFALFSSRSGHLSGFCAIKGTEMHIAGPTRQDGSRRDSRVARRLTQCRQPNAASDHGGGVPAHRRLQFPNVDKDTILTLEHAERLVNSVAVRGMDLRGAGLGKNLSFVRERHRQAVECRSLYNFVIHGRSSREAASRRPEDPFRDVDRRVQRCRVLNRGDAYMSRHGS